MADFLSREENIRMLERLVGAGIQIETEQESIKSGMADVTFVLTGALERMPRSHARRMIEAAGGKVTSSVSRKTDYLVAGASPGSKLDKAHQLKVTVIDENQLWDMLDRNDDQIGDA